MTRIIIEVDGDNVKVSTETKETEVKTESGKSGVETVSRYARFFDDGCTSWTVNAEYNLILLRDVQRYCNMLLQMQGYLFLNDVYEKLGIPKTKAGQIVGWIYDPDRNDFGDNFVDFGLQDERNRDFVNGLGNVALLDFNVDGEIISRLDKVMK